MGMKKFISRFLAVMLTIAMVLSTLSTSTAYAVETGDTPPAVTDNETDDGEDEGDEDDNDDPDGEEPQEPQEPSKPDIEDVEIKFAKNDYNNSEFADEVEGAVPYSNVTYDFKAEVEDMPDDCKISYAVTCTDSNNSAFINENTGKLEVYYPDEITVTATFSGNDNYEESEISCILNITGVTSEDGQYISFDESEVVYVLGTSDEISALEASVKDERITGEISYEISEESEMSELVSFDTETGKLTVEDSEALAEALSEADGELVVAVIATKEADERYGKDIASYTVTIKFEEIPEDGYKIFGTQGDNDWYIDTVTVRAAREYNVAKSISDEFESTVEFDDEGSEARYIYLRNATTGGITDKIELDIKIDTVSPDVSMKFSNTDDCQSIIFTVTEHNFDASSLVLSGKVVDICGDEIDEITVDEINAALWDAIWTADGDIYTCELEMNVDGIYELELDYTDIAGHSADTCEEEFVIDHEAPGVVEIEIDTASRVNVFKNILETITFHFYKSEVVIRLTAYDYVSGVEYFTWNYTKENGASDINRDTDTVETKVLAVQDSTDKSKFTAEITLPETDAEQIRGYLAATATDCYGNVSEKYTDSGDIIVVDTISPEISVEYSNLSNKVGTTYYYDGDIDVTLSVTEANFYSDDVVVTVTKDGVASLVTPDWTDVSTDEHLGRLTLSGDGNYTITVTYTDRSDNKAKSYTSKLLVIDTVAPVISVTYKNKTAVNKLTDSEGNTRSYYSQTQTAVITVTEHNFNSDDVDISILAKDVTGSTLSKSSLITQSSWSDGSGEDEHVITITYSGDANYTFDIAYDDLAKNSAKDYATDYFTVDTTAPTNLDVSYSTSILDTILSGITFGFYNAKVKVTITAEDNVSGVYSFLYSYKTASGVSSVNAGIIDQTISAANITYSNNGKKATATFEIPKSALTSSDQFNGNVEFTATDRSGNTSAKKADSKRIVVDNISPTVTVSYNDPVSTDAGVSYYDGNINATVTINEANFYSSDVVVTVTKDGVSSTVTPSWTDSSTDVHVGTFTLTEDGDYVISISYTDKSSNAMTEYTSEQLTIDNTVTEPTFTINGSSVEAGGFVGAYKGELGIGLAFEDENFDSYTVSLTRTSYGTTEDVTDQFVTVTESGSGGYAYFEIDTDEENDGIYLLTVAMTDKAGNESTSYIKFSVNRYGSVYVYSDYLVEIIADGGQYLTNVTEDLVITEYNADQISSVKILITRDGEAIDEEFTSDPNTIDSTAVTGDSGWYEYEYTISKDNFLDDGVYKITLMSIYTTTDSGDITSTSGYENSVDSSWEKVEDEMTFTVDATAPEIRDIKNLDQAIVNDVELNVEYTVADAGGLYSIQVYVDGELIDDITEEDIEDSYSYEGYFILKESSAQQTVRIIVTDKAGNITDTDDETFITNLASSGLYEFNSAVTVSTNFFVRWFANKALFWGSIIGALIVLGGFIFFIIGWRRKKEEEN